jgi:hypothetical protein
LIDFAFNGLTIFGGRSDVAAFCGSAITVGVSVPFVASAPLIAREAERVATRKARTITRCICNLKS